MLILILIFQTDIINPQNQAVANAILEHQNAKQIKLPDSVPASAGGLNKTSISPLFKAKYKHNYNLRSVHHSH